MFDWLRQFGPRASIAVSAFGFLVFVVPVVARWRRKRQLAAFHRAASHRKGRVGERG